jgi:hypothetical protein
MIFIMSSGLTLVFGLMDVMNFAHGLFIAVGAYVGASTVRYFSAASAADDFVANLGAILPAVLAAMVVAGLLGLAFERVIIRPVYGQHLKQILITTGGMIVAEQLILVFWGPDIVTLERPATLRGAFLVGDMAIEKYRLIAVVVGLAVFAAMMLVLNRTKIGLLIRAGVENKEMVEAMGYRIRRLFVGVFWPAPRSRPGRRASGHVPGSVTAAADDGADLHRHHHRRRLIGGCRGAAGGAGGELHRLPVAEDRARLQHPAHGAGAFCTRRALPVSKQ